MDIQLKQAEQVSYLFVTVHPDLKTGDGLHKDDDFYKENATTYVIRIKRLNTEAFQNIWVTDTEFKMTKKVRSPRTTVPSISSRCGSSTIWTT